MTILHKSYLGPNNTITLLRAPQLFLHYLISPLSLWFAFALYLLCCNPVFADDYKDSIQLNSARLLEVTYAYAIVELEIVVDDPKLANSYRNTASVFVTGVASGQVNLVKLKKGTNVIKAQLYRHNALESFVNSEKLSLRINGGLDKEDLVLNDARLPIAWPGPEYVHQILEGEPYTARKFDSVLRISIGTALPESNEIYVALLRAGYPIQKLLFRRTFHPRYTLTADKDIVDSDLRRIISAVVKNTQKPLKAKLRRNGTREIEIGINMYPRETLPEIDKKKLVSDKHSDKEFFRALSLEVSTNEERVQQMYDEAYYLIDIGKRKELQKAKSILDELLSLDPNFPRAYLELARYYMKTNLDKNGDLTANALKRAERNILVALDIDPDLADAYVLLGLVYTNQQRYKAAAEAYDKAETIGTDNLWLHANRARNFEEQNMTEKAITEYQRALDKPLLHGKNIYRPRSWSYQQAIRLLTQEKRYREADRLYSRYYADLPFYVCIPHEQAVLRLLFLNDVEGTIESYLKAKRGSCTRETAVIAAAYFTKWADLVDSNGEARLIRQTWRQAEGAITKEADLLLLLAHSEHTARVIPKLLKKGFDIDEPDDSGRNALAKAIFQADPTIIERLLVAGADPNYQANEESYPFIAFALYRKDREILELLLKYGADPTALTPDGLSMLQWAESNGLMDLLPLLKEKVGEHI